MGSHHPIIIFHTKEINDDSSLIDRPNFSVHHENWKSAEDRPELVDELHRRNLIKDGFFASKGMLNRLVRPFHLVLTGTLGLAITDGRPPRIVVDIAQCAAQMAIV